MENASKALIIAGAILLAIVLVSLGVLVINNSRKDINDKNLDEASIEAFNKNISQYCGKNKSGTQINSLMSAVAASNGAQLNKATKHYISYAVDSSVAATNYNGKSSETITSTTTPQYPTFTNEQTYDAEYTVGTDGYINKVTIK